MSTTIYSSTTVPAAGGNSLGPTSVALTHHLVSIHAKLTTSSAIPASEKTLQLVLAATPFSVTTADAPSQLPATYILTLKPKRVANGEVYFKSEPIIAEGLNLYAWVNADNLGADITLDAEVEEIA